jgi:hypothetical protein
MSEFLKIAGLSEAEVEKIEADIRAAIADKKARGLLTDKDVEEIIEMRLKPLPDIQDVQSVYENTLYTGK